MKKFCLTFSLLGILALTLKAQPVIIQSPTNQTVVAGGTISLNVGVSGTAPVFHWLKDDAFIEGATNSAYTITNASVVNSGIYRVMVTNIGGLVLSVPVRITVENTALLGWGNNASGQLGNGTYSNSYIPIRITNGVANMAGGDSHTLFVSADGTLWAMGQNIYGQLGIGSNTSTNLPTLVSTNVVCVTAGLYHSLFISGNGTLSAMGWNYYGQLGNSNNVDSNLPVTVASNVVAAAAGANHSLFIKTDGTLWAFGANYFGQLGNGTLNNTNQPVLAASNVVAVAAGYGHSLFIKADGSLWAMGYNQFGQLGDGTLINTNRPTLITNNVTAVASGYGHSLFLTQGGVLWAMGDNLVGQLGNTNLVQTNPFPALVASNVIEAAGGNSHTLFVKADGSLWAVGNNPYGQLGNGTTSNSAAPIMPAPSLVAGSLFQGPLAQFSLASGLLGSNATLLVSNLYQVYTGNPVGVTVTTIPAGLSFTLMYDGGMTQPTSPGNYTVVATVSTPGFYGSVTNTLVIGLPPQNLGASEMNGGQALTIKLTGTPNYPYFLQSTTNLTPPVNWRSVYTNFADLNGNWTWSVSNLTGLPECYFRAGAF